MDGLIVVLAIIGIILKASKNKNKQAQKGGAARPAPAKKASGTLDKWLEEALDEVDDDLDLEDLQILNKGAESIQNAITKAAKPKAAKAQAKPAPAKPTPQHAESLAEAAARRAAAEAAHAAARIPCHEHEGLHATQGETQAEHAQHLRRIREAEEAQRSTRETAAKLRDINLQKLRSAVVMSEVLGKPLAMRRSRR